MIGSTRAGRRAEQFDALIEGRPPGRAPSTELAELAGVVGSLRDVKPAEMRPEFAESLRARLMLEAPERLAELAASTAGDSGRASPSSDAAPPRLRIARIAAVTCLVVGISGGVAAASQSALPGDPLYGLKRGIEHAQVSLARSDASEGAHLVDQASTRLDEVNDLAVSRPDDPQTTRLIQQTLGDFSSQADDGASALISSYADDSDEQSIERLRQFADTSSDELDQLGQVVPAQAREQLVEAARLLSILDQNARDACADCSALAPLTVSDTVEQLANTAQSILDLPSTEIPTNDPGGTPTDRPRDRDKPDDAPAQEAPSGPLPSLPALTPVVPPAGSPTQPGTTSGGNGGDGGHGGGSGGQGTTKPPPLLPELPLPDLPLPSLPLVGDLGGLLGGGQAP